MSKNENKKRKHSDDEGSAHDAPNPIEINAQKSTDPEKLDVVEDADKNTTSVTDDSSASAKDNEKSPEIKTKKPENSADEKLSSAEKLTAEVPPHQSTDEEKKPVASEAPAASGSAGPSPSKTTEKSPQEKQNLLDQLKTEILNDNNLPLGGKNAKLVFGRGSASADIVFIGEAPGEQEEKTGIPFVGPAGKKLDSLLAGIGLNADKIYICNVLKYRPPDNRDPNAKEVQLHTPYLLRQLTIIAPKLIVPMGNWASKYVLSGFDPKGMNKIDGMQKTHGKRSSITSPDGDLFEVLPSLHPAAVLHQERYEPDIKFDFEKIKEYTNSEEFKDPKKKSSGPSPAKKQKTIMSFFTPKK